jgi:alcohol dehydrogenase
VQFVIGDLMRDADELLGLVRAGAIDPGVVASESVALEDAPEAYRRMTERRTLKSLISM